MSNDAGTKIQATAATSWDLFRLSKSKEIVDLAPNTLRAYQREGGISFYQRGKAVFVSRAEVAAYIMAGRTTRGGQS